MITREEAQETAAKYRFTLGALDTEMLEIQHLLEANHIPWYYASVGGDRVLPFNAYQSSGEKMPLFDGQTRVFVECDSPGVEGLHIDHHRPGDPGYDKGPDQYLEGSSLGQVAALLGVELDQRQKTIASLDHCPAAALKGLCPGIDPNEAMLVRAEEIIIPGVGPAKAIDDIVNRATELFHVPNKKIQMGKQEVYDLRGYKFDMRLSLLPPAKKDLALYMLQVTQTAALYSGEVALITQIDNKGEKVTMIGDATPETVEHFMKSWGPEQKLTGIYGTPSRGFAGGYVS